MAMQNIPFTQIPMRISFKKVDKTPRDTVDPTPSLAPSVIRQSLHHLHTEYHHQQADRDDDEQREAEPSEHHGGGADARLDAAVAQVLSDGRGGDRGRVLPQNRHQHEDGADEDDGERDL